MATRQYIGARYVPKFYENSVDGSTQWESNVVYAPLIYVTLTNGHMYLSKKQVPATVGTPASNAAYWLDIGDYNGFIEELQDEIDDINNRLIGKIVDMTKQGLPTDGTSDCSSIFTGIIASDPTKIYYIPSGHYVFNSAPSLGSYGTIVDLIIDKDATTNYNAPATAPFYANWSFIDSTKVHIIYNSLHSLTMGGTNYIDYEVISNGAKAAYAEITAISPDGTIGLLGGSDTKNLAGGTGYPIGVMGMSMADDTSNLNPNNVGAFYGETYRNASTTGASIGMELDHKIDVDTQNITPNDLSSGEQNYATALQLSNGMGESTHRDLSCGIRFNNNGGKFKKGILFNKESIASTVIGKEAISMASDHLVDWYDETNPTIPSVEVFGNVYNGAGKLTAALLQNGNYVPKHITPDSMLGSLKFKFITIASATYAGSSPVSISLASYLDSGYDLHSLLMVQYQSATAGSIVFDTLASNSIAGYNFGGDYTGPLTLAILEYKDV